MKQALAKCFLSVAFAGVLVLALSSESWASLVSYNLTASVEPGCDGSMCYVRGTFDLESANFNSGPQAVINPMFELVTIGDVVVDSFSGPFNIGISAETSATGEVVHLGATHLANTSPDPYREIILTYDLPPYSETPYYYALWVSGTTDPLSIANTYECPDDSCEIQIGPSVVPLPATLPLFGSALAIIGFIGCLRRRRSALAAI